jgi:hypothetical protein
MVLGAQIAGGVWYIGVFSDAQPSRYQSKMVGIFLKAATLNM